MWALELMLLIILSLEHNKLRTGTMRFEGRPIIVGTWFLQLRVVIQCIPCYKASHLLYCIEIST